MEGKTRPRQRTSEVLRKFTPTRLQDDLLAAVYDRLLHASSLAGGVRDEPTEREPELESVSTGGGWLADTGGRHG
jgi:hypothetical protein